MKEDKEVQLARVPAFGHVASARPEAGAVPISLGDGLLLPSRYRCSIETAELPGIEIGMRVRVAEDGVATCFELVIRQADEDASLPITRATLDAVRIGDLLQIGNGVAMEKVEYVGDRIYLAPMSRDDVEDVHGRYVGRRKPIPAQELERVAAIYREALSAGLPPTKTVHERMGISRSHAGRLVMRARDYGLLGPALGRKAGEDRR